MCGPSIATFSASRSSAAPPTWSIWPWVSQIFSTVTSVCLIAARIFGTSPPGSITTAFLLGSHQRMVQFCSNSVTGTMIAPAFALVSVLVWFPGSWQHNADFLHARQVKDFAHFGGGTAAFDLRLQGLLRNRIGWPKWNRPPPRSASCRAPDRRQSETALAIARGTARLLRSLGFSCISELPLPSGRRADLVALNERGEIWIVEIKSSVEDLRADHKWEDYRAHCDRLFFAFTQDLPCEIFPEQTGLIVADAYGAHLHCEAPEHRLPAPTRKLMTVRFALAAAQRINRLVDPQGGHGEF